MTFRAFIALTLLGKVGECDLLTCRTFIALTVLGKVSACDLLTFRALAPLDTNPLLCTDE